jgi:GxxExxY protein
LQNKGKEIGRHRIDFLVENEVIVELKAVEGMNKIYEAQLLTYLRAMGKRVGLLINFNVERLRDGIKRLIIQRAQRGGNKISHNILMSNIFPVFSVVRF